MAKKAKILTLALSGILALGVGFIGITIAKANADEYTVTEATYENEYLLNEMVSVDDVTFTIDGEEIKADWAIRYPNGETYKLSAFECTQVGRYTITYKVTKGKKSYTKEYSFIVDSGLFGGENVSAKYVHYDFSDVGNIENYAYGTANFDENRSRPIDGYLCEVAPGNSLVFNQIINVTGLTQSDTLIKVHPLAQTLGVTDYEYMRVKITDVYDENNFIYVEPHDVTDAYDYGYRISYCQASYGYELPAYLSNEGKGIRKGGYYGARISPSFHGMPNGAIADFPVSVAYDDATKQIFVCGTMIADLDDMNYFDTPWEGFTTGEVRISVEVDRMAGGSAQYIISQIYGCDDLAAATYVDDEGPKIVVDYGEYTQETYPDGQVGYPYPVYKATAFDKHFGTQDVISTVYYNYDSNQKVAIDVKDGVFYPMQAGVYKIVYTAYDQLNNKTEFSVPVVINGENANNVQANYLVSNLNGTLGETITMGLPIVSGGYGNYAYKLDLSFNGEVISSGNDAFTYMPLKAGEYTLKCTITDAIGQKGVAETKVTMVMNAPRLIIDDYKKIFPDSFVAGYTYEIPEIKAYDFNAGAYTSAVAEFSVGDYKDGKYIAPYDVNSVEVTIKPDDSGLNDVVFTKPVYNVSNTGNSGYDTSKFFITDGAVSASFNAYGNSKIQYLTYTMPVGSTSMQYFNKCIAHGFGTAISFPNETFNYNEIKISFIDSENEDVAVVFNFKNKKDKLYYSINDGKENLLGEAIGENRINEFTFKFDADVNTMFFNGIYYAIETDAQGKDFAGFPSQLIYFNLEITATDSDNRIVIKNVSNQPLTSSKRDEIKPVIYTTGMPLGFLDFGANVTLGEVYASDAISPTVKVTYTLKTPSGLKVVNQPYEEGYTFKLEEYGQYIVLFNAVDLEGNQTEYQKVFSIRDMESPEIDFKGTVVQTCSVNKTIKLAALQLSDNFSETDKLQCTIFIRNDQFTSVVVEYTGNDTYTFTKAGVYTVWYYVVDETGNSAVISYTITVR